MPIFILIWSVITLFVSILCIRWHERATEYFDYLWSGLTAYLGIPASIFGIGASIYLIIISR